MVPCILVDKYVVSVEHTASYFYPEYQSNSFLYNVGAFLTDSTLKGRYLISENTQEIYNLCLHFRIFTICPQNYYNSPNKKQLFNLTLLTNNVCKWDKILTMT